MYYGHRDGYGNPPGTKTPVTNCSSVHTSNTAPDGPELFQALVREAPLHATCGTRGSDSHVPHSACSVPRVGVDRAWLFPVFHQYITDWRALVLQAVASTTHMDEIVHHESTHLGFCDVSCIGSGGVWIKPVISGHSHWISSQN